MMEKRPAILLNSRTYGALLVTVGSLEDPKTGTSPISFKRLVSTLADTWLRHNIPDVDELDED